MGINTGSTRPFPPLGKQGSIRPLPKREHPFGFPQTPFDPRTGKFLAFGGDDESAAAAAAAAASVKTAIVVEEFGDYLETSIGRVSKPWLLRQSPFENEAFNGVTYAYSSVNERSATDGVDTETQQITPSYVVGEQLLTLAGVDLNTAGRCWAAVEEE